MKTWACIGNSTLMILKLLPSPPPPPKTCFLGLTIIHTNHDFRGQLTVADPDFPRWGGGGSPTYNLAKFLPSPRKLRENERIGQRGGRPSCPPLDPPIAYHRAQISDHNSLSDRIPIHIALALAISNIGGLNTLSYIAMPHFRWIKYIAMLCYALLCPISGANRSKYCRINCNRCPSVWTWPYGQTTTLHKFVDFFSDDFLSIKRIP